MLERAIIFGVFDKLHPGHLWFLKIAKKYSKKIIVVLATNQQVLRLKRHLPKDPYKIRKKNLKGLADLIIPSDNKVGEWSAIKHLTPQAIITGYDQNELRAALKPLKKIQHFKIIKIRGVKINQWKSSLMK